MAATYLDKNNAMMLFGSPRGQYIMAQALHVAIREMKRVNPPHQETSNIADMELLAVLFEPFTKMFNSGTLNMTGGPSSCGA